MLNNALLWGADQVCNVLGHNGLANVGVCIYRGSYIIDISFLVAITLLTILVVIVLRRKW